MTAVSNSTQLFKHPTTAVRGAKCSNRSWTHRGQSLRSGTKSHLRVSFKLRACLQHCDLMHTSKPQRVPQHTLGAPSIPSGLRKLPFPTQSAIKGDILEEAIQTVSNEFLTTSVASGKEKESGKHRGRERPLLNALQWFVGSPLSRSKRPPPLRSSGC